MHDAKVLLEISDSCGPYVPVSEQEWMIFLDKEGYGLHPYPFTDVLFRGQNKRISPSRPSLLRGLERYSPVIADLSMNDQVVIAIRMAKSWWFSEEIARHPAIMWVKQEGLDVDPIPLAQHYGLATSYMDATHSFDVAAFFATCFQDANGWHPMTDGAGIIYRVELSKVKEPLEFAKAVGLQPLPRPAEQCAWGIDVPLGYDFDKHPALLQMEFRHSEEVSRHFLEKFDYGRTLFPPDPMALIAAEIKAADEVASGLIYSVIETIWKGESADQRSSLREAVAKQIGLGGEVNLMAKQNLDVIEREWDERKESFGKRVHVRPVRLEPVENPSA